MHSLQVSENSFLSRMEKREPHRSENPKSHSSSPDTSSHQRHDSATYTIDKPPEDVIYVEMRRKDIAHTRQGSAFRSVMSG